MLVQRLLAFARRQPLQPEAVDIAALIAAMRDLVTTTCGPKIEIQMEVPDELPLALADTNQIEMALLNLSVNARDAMPSGGRLVIAARRMTPDLGHSEIGDGDYVVISVTDTGHGMDEATRRRAIEPFFSTKGIGQGTGLGLSMAHGLALQLGGALTIDSVLDAGTTVSLWLPVSTHTETRSSPTVTHAAPVTGVALLVDDEDLVRASTCDMLVELGFQVIEASSGPQALAELARIGRVDVVITDHLMPEMTGVELANAVARERPGMPVLIVSGYSDAIGIDAQLPRLEKPFRQIDLSAALASLLAKLKHTQPATGCANGDVQKTG